MGYTIIIPVKEINDYIHESIPISLALDYEEFEIIILPNEPPQKSELTDYLLDEKVKIISSGKVSPSIKRDLGAKHAKYEYLAFLDDDAYPQKNWLSVADRVFSETDADCLGGPAITPKNASPSQFASGLFFETLIGGGGMSYRYKPAKKSFYVDDFPTVNLIISKKSFDAIGGFDNDYWPGEDTKLCLDLVKNGYKIWYEKDLIVWHHRRKLFYPHLKQVGNYGKHRGYFAKVFPETSRRLTYFAPSIFFLGHLGLILLSLVDFRFFNLLLVLLGIYFTVAVFDVFFRTKNVKLIFLTVVTIYLSHLTYGFMFIKGLTSSKFKSQLR